MGEAVITMSPSISRSAHAAIETVTAVIDRLASARETTLPDGRKRSIDPFAVSNAAGELLGRAAQGAPAGSVVEVGCASALSTLHVARGRLAAGLLDGGAVLHAIDPKQSTHWDSIGRMHIGQAGLGQLVELHERPAHVVLPEPLDHRPAVGFAFLDGWHMLDHVMLEAFYVDLMLNVGGVMALHDLWMPGLQHFACFWLTNRPYEAVTIACDDVGSPRLVPRPCPAGHREAGDLLQSPALFRDRILPFVDQSVLLLRKRDHDRRRWDDFWPYE